MEKIVSKIQVSCKQVQDNIPKISYDQGINTIGAASSFTAAYCSNENRRLKQNQNKITSYKYAQELRDEIAKGKLRAKEAETMLKDLGISKNYFKYLYEAEAQSILNESKSTSMNSKTSRFAVLNTGKSTSPYPNTSQFASLSTRFWSKPERNRHIKCVEVIADSPANFIVKQNPTQSLLAGLFGVMLYFTFLKIIKNLVKAAFKVVHKNKTPNQNKTS